MFIFDWCNVHNPLRNQGTTVILSQAYAHTTRVRKVAASATADRIVSASDEILNFWDYKNDSDEFEVYNSLSLVDIAVSRLRFADNGNLVIMQYSGAIKIINSESGEELGHLPADTLYINFEIFDESNIVATTARRGIRFFTVQNGKITQPWAPYENRGQIRSDISCMDMLKKDGMVHYVMGHQDGTVSYWIASAKNISNLKNVFYREYQIHPVTRVCILDVPEAFEEKNNQVRIVMHIETTACCHFVDLSQETKKTLIQPEGMSRSVSLDKSRRYVFVGTSDGYVFFYYLKNGALVQRREPELADSNPLLDLSFGKNVLIGQGMQNLEPITILSPLE